jgi:hypothetical protein
MSYDSNEIMERAIKEAYTGPVIPAGPGFFLLHDHDPERAPEPILAWRIGSDMVLPVTALGCAAGMFHILYPDGSVWPHFCEYGSHPRMFKSLAEWHDCVTAQNEPEKSRTFEDGLRDMGLEDVAKIDGSTAEVRAAERVLIDAAKALFDVRQSCEAKDAADELTGQNESPKKKKKKLQAAKTDKDEIPF